MRCVHSNFVIANVGANTGTVLTTITNKYSSKRYSWWGWSFVKVKAGRKVRLIMWLRWRLESSRRRREMTKSRWLSPQSLEVTRTRPIKADLPCCMDDSLNFSQLSQTSSKKWGRRERRQINGRLGRGGPGLERRSLVRVHSYWLESLEVVTEVLRSFCRSV